MKRALLTIVFALSALMSLQSQNLFPTKTFKGEVWETREDTIIIHKGQVFIGYNYINVNKKGGITVQFKGKDRNQVVPIPDPYGEPGLSRATAFRYFSRDIKTNWLPWYSPDRTIKYKKTGETTISCYYVSGVENNEVTYEEKPYLVIDVLQNPNLALQIIRQHNPVVFDRVVNKYQYLSTQKEN